MSSLCYENKEKMKHCSTILEPWSTKEKLCLSSAVLKNGDQNWMPVSRTLRLYGEQERPPEWYSQNQCALQYEALLNSVSTSKRKMRSEKGVDIDDVINCENIVRKLLQERLEELRIFLEADRKEYLRTKTEIEDIESGKLDDQLDKLEKEIEEENEREAILQQNEERSRLDSESSLENSHDFPEAKVPTSPLLTSLLQSPSNYRGTAASHNLISPTRVSDSPTLSRLLETPTKQLEPSSLFSTCIKKEQDEEESKVCPNPDHSDEPAINTLPGAIFVEDIQTSEVTIGDIKVEEQNEKELQTEEETIQVTSEETSGVQIEEAVVELSSETDVEKTDAVPNSQPDNEELDGEKEEQEQSSLVTLQESDSMEEQHSIAELDSQMVNMIVAGEGVISVSHSISSEHLELTSSDTQHKEDTEAADNSQDVKTGGEVEEAVVEDTTVHEVEVMVASSKNVEHEDSTQDNDVKDQVHVSDTEPPDEDEDHQEEDEDEEEEDENTISKTRREEVNEKEDKEEEEEDQSQSNLVTPMVSRSIAESPNTTEDDSETVKRSSKKRLISGSGCSDSKPNSPASHILEDSKEYRSWKKSIMLVFNRMATHKYASIFLRPITNEQAPAYDSVIHRPVDLSTIKKRIETGELRTTVEFQRDLLLMFQNAIMYNNSRTLVFEMATTMQNECMQHIELMVEAMGEGVPWRKDNVAVDKFHTRGRGEAPKRKRTSLEDTKTQVTPKRRKEPSI